MKSRRKILIRSLTELFFILLVTILSVVYLVVSVSAPKETNTPKVVIVNKEQDEKSILEDLRSKGLIKNEITYYLVLALSKLLKPIEPGGYVFSGRYDALAIHSAISNPKYKYISIADGLRNAEIADALEKKLDWPAEKVQKLREKSEACSYANEEGYLAPGDYLIDTESTLQEVQLAMNQKFEEEYANLEEKLQNQKVENLLNKKQIVTIASLIQKESGGKKDMRLISGIIWNRIFENMPLQIDATLQYVKGEDGKWWPKVKPEDKYLESPYNTYQETGLPPGPIANVNVFALEAAMNPVRTNCIFYIHDKNGNIHCSSTYDGHLANIKSYLR